MDDDNDDHDDDDDDDDGGDHDDHIDWPLLGLFYDYVYRSFVRLILAF